MKRLVLAGLFAGIGAIWWGIAFYGLIDLTTPFIQESPDFYDSYLLETGWGLLYTVLIAIPLIALVRRPQNAGPMGQLIIASAAVAVPALLVPEPLQLQPAAALLLSFVVLRALARHGHGFDRANLGESIAHRARRAPLSSWALVLVATVAAVPYAADMIAAGRAGRYPADFTADINHWPMQSSLALCIPACAAAAALRPRGWKVPAVTAAVAAIWLGALSFFYPEHAASLGRVGGLGCVSWGLLLVADAYLPAERRHRQG
jgi:hypothetical protein